MLHSLLSITLLQEHHQHREMGKAQLLTYSASGIFSIHKKRKGIPAVQAVTKLPGKHLYQAYNFSERVAFITISKLGNTCSYNQRT